MDRGRPHEDGRSSDVPLTFVDLGRRYRRRRPWALRHVRLSVPPGSATAVVGPNGAGKSTLLRSCIGFEHADEGHVEVYGLSPNDRPRDVLRLVAYVPQRSSLHPGLTIEDHLVLAAAARQSFDASYARNRLDDASLATDRRVGELSGGEQAKVALAIAVGTSAPLLLLDEPLASLDPLSRREFIGLVASDSKRRGTTVVLASHVIDEIELICDRLVVLGHGRVLLTSSIADAKDAFSVAADRPSIGEAVGRFIGRSGDALALVPKGIGDRAATVEEIVLGHLAQGRAPAEAVL